MTRAIYKESVQSTPAKQRQQATCYHSWTPAHGLVFDWIKVEARCSTCGTYWAQVQR